MEMIFLCSVISQLQNEDICQTVKIKVRMHTGVIWPRGVNIGNRPLIEAKMKGGQVRDLDCRRKRNVIILVGNQRTVTMAAYGKSIGDIYSVVG